MAADSGSGPPGRDPQSGGWALKLREAGRRRAVRMIDKADATPVLLHGHG